MGYSMDELEKIQENYIQDFFKPPFYDYLSGIVISTLDVMTSIKGFEDFELRTEESLDDLCLSVRFIEKLPSDLQLPSDYKGVRVFYEIRGIARLL